MESTRIDKWLWAARFFKTRGLATEAVLGGHVRLNGDRVKPAKDVRIDDMVEIRIGEVLREVVVRDVADGRLDRPAGAGCGEAPGLSGAG